VNKSFRTIKTTFRAARKFFISAGINDQIADDLSYLTITICRRPTALAEK